MISELERQRMQHPTPDAYLMYQRDQYMIGSTRILCVREEVASTPFGYNTYLVERNGIYFHMTGPELEASTGAFAY